MHLKEVIPEKPLFASKNGKVPKNRLFCNNFFQKHFVTKVQGAAAICGKLSNGKSMLIN
jgi:hypothetical protein